MIGSPIQGGVHSYNLQWGTGVNGWDPSVPQEPAIFGEWPACPTTTYTADAGDTPNRPYTMCNGMFPWLVFLNHGGGSFGQTRPFNFDPIVNGGVPVPPTHATWGPLPDRIIYQPIPLETTAGDSSLTSSPTGTTQGTVDLDGDGYADAVYRPRYDGPTAWSLYLNDRTGRFAPYSQAAPFLFSTGPDYRLSSTTGLPAPKSLEGLFDFHGDGLVDHWIADCADCIAQAALSDGVQFRLPGGGPELGTMKPGVNSRSFDVVQLGSFIESGWRIDSRSVIDVDVDGRADIAEFPSDAPGILAPKIYFNQGGLFASNDEIRYDLASTNRILGKKSWIGDYMGPPTSYTWETRTGMVDLDGDGIPEAVSFPNETTNPPRMWSARIPTPTQPPRLLASIDNGRGAVTTVTYSAMHGAAVQYSDPYKAMPRSEWVVQSVTVDDSLANTTTSRSYSYKNPRYHADDQGRYGFRGFDEVTTTRPTGRMLERFEAVANAGNNYQRYKLEYNTYVDAPAPSVTHYSAIDVTSSVVRYAQDKTELDGHGRPIRKTAFALGAAPADHVTTFVYRNDGTLAEARLPDPTANNTSTVSYLYSFDSLGRATSLRRPAAGVPALPSGVDITYDGLRQTSTEFLGGGPGENAITTTLRDRYGRLVQVDEQLEGAPIVTWASASYRYGADDHVAQIVDPENVATTLTHDLAGQRTAITRAGRTWTYGYDKNGNPTSQISPCTDPMCEANYVSTTVYDELDRPESKVNAPRDLSAPDLALFGAGTETFTWDGGWNGKGRLRSWQTYAPGASGNNTTLVARWTYDAQGRQLNTEHIFNGAGYSNLNRTFLRFFRLSGKPAAVYTRESVGTQNCTSGGYYEIKYDNRGLDYQVQALTCLYQSGTPYSYWRNTRNVAGLVTKQHAIAGPYGPFTYAESNWTYDKLGRVESQTVNTGSPLAQVVKQQLAYFGNDDPKTLDHWLGATNQKQFAFAFDKRHQLKTVTETTTTGYFAAGYDYGNAGRFTRATESTSGAPGSNVVPRDVDYQYQGLDPEHVTALVDHITQQPLRSYEYDAAGNQTISCEGSLTAGVCSGPSLTFVYDGKNQLRRVTKRGAGGTVLGSEEYWYDHEGTRTQVVRRDASGNKTGMRWFIGDTEAEYDTAGTVTHAESQVRLGGRAVMRLRRDSDGPSSIDYKFQGLADNTLATVDQATGTVNASFIYAPFGEIIEATDGGAPTNGIDQHRRRMNDKYVDELSDLAYYGFRYYDKLSMTWTQSDPFYRFAPDAAWAEPRRAQLYTFTGNNPLRYLDPDGRLFRELFEQVTKPAATFNPSNASAPVTPAQQDAIGSFLAWAADVATDYVAEEMVKDLTADDASPGMGGGNAGGDENGGGGPGDGNGGSPRYVYRGGSSTDDNMTPRPGRDTTGEKRGLSTFDTIEKATTPGGKAQKIDTTKLPPCLGTHCSPDGHVSIRPKKDAELEEWAKSRGTGEQHPLTKAVQESVVEKDVRRPK